MAKMLPISAKGRFQQDKPGMSGPAKAYEQYQYDQSERHG